MLRVIVIMGSLPFLMWMVTMQSTISSMTVKSIEAKSQLRGTDIKDVSMATVRRAVQQGLENLKKPQKKEPAVNRALKLSLSELITDPSTDSIGSRTTLDITTTSASGENDIMMVQWLQGSNKDHKTDIEDEDQVMRSFDQDKDDNVTVSLSIISQRRHELKSNPDLSSAVDNIRITSAASSLLNVHLHHSDSNTLASKNRVQQDEQLHNETTADVQVDKSKVHHNEDIQPQTQPGTQLYGESSSYQAISPKSSAQTLNPIIMWQTHFAKPTAPVKTLLIPDAERGPPIVSTSMFDSQTTKTTTATTEEITSLSSKPIMFTFYTAIDEGRKQTGMSPDADYRLLEAWNEEWSNAGWEPRVITLQTAMEHPSFEKLNLKLSSLVKSISTYDRFCFLRWLAMVVATTGTKGGWMSDYDTFPLHPLDGRMIPNGGRLTVHENSKNGGVPSLISGSPEEWDRLAMELIHNAYLHRDERFWSDMFALHDIYVSSGKTIYMMEHGVTPAQVVMRKHGIEPRTCLRTQSRYAIHFSHYAIENGNMEAANITESATLINIKPEHRSSIAKEWLRRWRELCIDGQKEPVAPL